MCSPPPNLVLGFMPPSKEKVCPPLIQLKQLLCVTEIWVSQTKKRTQKQVLKNKERCLKITQKALIDMQPKYDT